MKFIPMLQEIYDRLSILASIEIKTESEKIEEKTLSRRFRELLPLNDRVKYGGIVGYDPHGLTEVQSRIMKLARYQTP